MKSEYTLALLTVVLLAWAAPAAAQFDLILPDEVWDDMWVFRDLCPMDPERPADPAAVTGFRYDMLDLDQGDDFYFTWVALPTTFGWDGMTFPVFVDGIEVGTITPDLWLPGQPVPLTRLNLGGVKSFEIRDIPIGSIDPLDPNDQDIFPFWVGWTPNECGADIGVTPIPEPAMLSLLALGGLTLARRRR